MASACDLYHSASNGSTVANQLCFGRAVTIPDKSFYDAWVAMPPTPKCSGSVTLRCKDGVLFLKCSLDSFLAGTVEITDVFVNEGMQRQGRFTDFIVKLVLHPNVNMISISKPGPPSLMNCLARLRDKRQIQFFEGENAFWWAPSNAILSPRDITQLSITEST